MGLAWEWPDLLWLCAIVTAGMQLATFLVRST